MRQVLILVTFILSAQLAGILGSIFTIGSIETWYQTLAQPPLTPPSFIFGPVWTTLYTLMGIAAYLVWRSNSPQKWNALSIFFIHLGVNASWSIVFFGTQSILGALIIILLLDVLILEVMRRFYKFSKVATILLVPYLLWALFATYLNIGFYVANL